MRYERVNRYLDSSFRVKLSDSGYDSRTRIGKAVSTTKTTTE